jgi:membrane dipeptidase
MHVAHADALFMHVFGQVFGHALGQGGDQRAQAARRHAAHLIQQVIHLHLHGPDFDLRIEKICEHIDHICQLAGNASHVGIGSDLDGGFGTEQTPLDLDSIADLGRLDGLLASRGYSAADIEGIFFGNVVGFLRRSLPE